MASRYFNPLALWTDVAAKTGNMLLSSSTVVQIRTHRMLSSAFSPSEADLRELGLMGQEKVAAVSESGAAMANQLHSTHFALTHRAPGQSVQGRAAAYIAKISGSYSGIMGLPMFETANVLRAVGFAI